MSDCYPTIALRTGVVLCTLASLACHRASSASTSEGTASESAGDSGDETSDDSGTTGPSEPPWGEPIDPCEGVTCSGHGTCVSTGAVVSCECEDGFLARRHECLTCTPLGEDHVYNIDVPMITVQPVVTVAGGPPPLDGHGGIYVVSGSDTAIGIQLPDSPPATTLIPGVYDFRFYRNYNPDEDESLPHQNDVIYATNRAIELSGEVLIDLPVVTVTSALSTNGGAPSPWSPTLVDPVSGEWADFDTATFDVIPGTYDILTSVSGAVLARNAVIAQSGYAVFDIGSIDQHGTLTVGGQVFDSGPVDPFESDVDVSLFNPELGRQFLGSPTFDAGYHKDIIPGTYDILYERWGDNIPGLPDNEYAILPAGLLITTDGGVTNVDIPIITRSGALTLNGVPVAANEWGSELYYINRTTGDRVLIRDLAWGEYSIEMIPGVYDLLYDLYEPRVSLPANRSAVIATGLVIDESGNLDIDVPMITMTGSVTVNGLVVGVPEQAEIEFWQAEARDEAPAGDISVGSYSVNLIRGTYDVRYRTPHSNTNPPVGLPLNRVATVLGQVVLTESGILDVDIPAVEVTGSITINGEAVPGGEINLVGDTGYDARLGGSAAPYSTLIVPGTYAVTYGTDDPPELLAVPRNGEAILDCIVIE
jgi:hypothetical protein